MNTPGEVVTAFCGAISTLDMRRAVAYLADDVVFDNVPQPMPAKLTRGPEAVRQRLQMLLDACVSAEFEVLAQVEQDDCVMNERIDRFQFKPGLFPGGDLLEWPVATRFDLVDGKIALWRDYYDLNAQEPQLGVDLKEFGRIIGQNYAGG